MRDENAIGENRLAALAFVIFLSPALRLFPSAAAAAMAPRIRSPASSSSTAKVFSFSAASSAGRSSEKARSATPPQRAMWVPMTIPRVRRAEIATAPTATSAAVSRPEK